MSSFKNQNRKGFTLIELLVVIAIIGILASVVLSSLSSAKQAANNAKKKIELGSVLTALQMYYLDKNSVPSKRNGGNWDPFGASSDLTLSELVTAGYISKLPVSPDADVYYYYDYGSYVIVSSRFSTFEYGPWTQGWHCSASAGGSGTSKYYCLGFTK